MSSPNSVLSRLGGARGLVRERGGLLVVLSCFQWDQNITPKSLWLGGFVDPASGREVLSEDTLQARLADDFTLLEKTLLPALWLSGSKSALTGKLFNATVWARK